MGDGIDLQFHTVPGRGVELPFEALNGFVIPYMHQHQKTAQFALSRQDSVAAQFDDVARDDPGNMMFLSSLGKPLRAFGPIAQRMPALWEETLWVSSMRYQLPAEDRFTIDVVAHFAPTLDMSPDVGPYQSILKMTGQRQPGSLMVEKVYVGDVEYVPCSRGVSQSLLMLQLATAYAIETHERNGEASSDYLPHILGYIRPTFEQRAERAVDQIALYREKLPEINPRRAQLGMK